MDSISQLVQTMQAGFDRLDAKVDALHQSVAKLEQLPDLVRAVGERDVMNHESLTGAMSDMERRLATRITDLEDAVRTHSTLLQQNVADIEKLMAEVASLRRRFDQRDDLATLEQRVSALEAHMKIR